MYPKKLHSVDIGFYTYVFLLAIDFDELMCAGMFHHSVVSNSL